MSFFGPAELGGYVTASHPLARPMGRPCPPGPRGRGLGRMDNGGGLALPAPGVGVGRIADRVAPAHSRGLALCAPRPPHPSIRPTPLPFRFLLAQARRSLYPLNHPLTSPAPPPPPPPPLPRPVPPQCGTTRHPMVHFDKQYTLP